MKVKIQRDSMSDDGEGSLDPSNSEQLPRQLHGSRVVLSKPTKLGAGHLLGMGAVNPHSSHVTSRANSWMEYPCLCENMARDSS